MSLSAKVAKIAYDVTQLRIREGWSQTQVRRHMLERYGMRVSLNWIRDNIGHRKDVVPERDPDEDEIRKDVLDRIDRARIEKIRESDQVP